MELKNSGYENFYSDSDFQRRLFFNRIKLSSIFTYLDSNHEWLLDIGCGTADDTNIMSQFAHNCVGLDFSKKGLKKAKRKYPHVDFVCGDALSPPFKSNAFGSVFSSNISTYNTYDHSEIWKQLKIMYEQVRRDGSLIVIYSSCLLGKKGLASEWKDLLISDFVCSLKIGRIESKSQVFYVNPMAFIFLKRFSLSFISTRISTIIAPLFRKMNIPGYIVVYCHG
jgi:SAM-dependent methyltransferase